MELRGYRVMRVWDDAVTGSGYGALVKLSDVTCSERAGLDQGEPVLIKYEQLYAQRTSNSRQPNRSHFVSLQGSFHALPYHIERNQGNSDAKDLAEQAYIHLFEQAGTCQCTKQYADEYGAGNGGDNDAALNVDDCTCAGCDNHQKVTARSAN